MLGFGAVVQLVLTMFCSVLVRLSKTQYSELHVADGTFMSYIIQRILLCVLTSHAVVFKLFDILKRKTYEVNCALCVFAQP